MEVLAKLLIYGKRITYEALAKPQVSPLALKIQPLSGLSQVSPGVKATGTILGLFF